MGSIPTPDETTSALRGPQSAARGGVGGLEGKKLLSSQSATKEAAVAATLRGRFVETGQWGGEETTGFSLEDVTVVETEPEETSGPDVEGSTVNLDMPSAVAGENWVGQEVIVEGRLDTGLFTSRQVFVVENIDEA